MGIKITELESDGLLARAGLTAGCVLNRINGQPTDDILDVMFHAADERLRLAWTDPQGRRRRSLVERSCATASADANRLGASFEPLQVRTCRNNCVFCFVHQLPRGLRRTLYVKDEDYRLSFLHGHYITGTGLTRRELKRIANFRLSPLYISVQATDPELRRRMLGRKSLEPITELLDFLRDNRIEFHAQVVLCPGWNDGPQLERTLDELEVYWPCLGSVAIVPVGLTAHRQGLPRLRPVTPAFARKLIRELRPRQRKWRQQAGDQLIYLADEFFLICGQPPPSYRGCPELPQLENGVGMVALFMRPWRRTANRLPRAIVGKRRRVGLVTGKLGAKVLAPVAKRLDEIKGLTVRLLVTDNQLLGRSVTVSGLLGGEDIARTIMRAPGCDEYLVPANALRPEDELFLDDMSLAELSQRVERPVRAVAGDVAELCAAVLDLDSGKL
ncbi:DUF512 domain-containing protein [Candidatus Sumerlaeota bacterium]